MIRPKVTDRDACACKLHKNLSLKIKKISSGSLKHREQEMLCSLACVTLTALPACMTHANTVKPGFLVTWQDWVSRPENVGSEEEKEIKNTSHETRNTSIEKFEALTSEILPSFAAHLFNINHQFLTEIFERCSP